MAYFTQAHKFKEIISVSFFKYGKQKPYTNHIQWTKLPRAFFKYESKKSIIEWETLR